MKSRFDPQKHHRRSIRLKHYDYSAEGTYYVTIVAQDRDCVFGEIVDGEMHLNEYGKVVQRWWEQIPIHFPHVTIGAFIIMPNHVHGILFITNVRRGEITSPPNDPDQNDNFIEQVQGGEAPPLRKPTLGQIIAYFKYQSTKEINLAGNTGVVTKIWQRNYYEHIIRNQEQLKQKTDYILNNPARWEKDHENPQTKKTPG